MLGAYSSISPFSSNYHVCCPFHIHLAIQLRFRLQCCIINIQTKDKERPGLPSAPSHLQSCDSPEAVLTVLREQIPGFNESRNGEDGLTKWVTPTVNVLYSFSSTIGGGVGLVSTRLFPRVKSFGSNICFFRYYLRRT